MSKATEQLAREAGFYNGEIGDLQSELETFRRLVIEDYIAGLEPVAWKHPITGGIVRAVERIPGVTLGDFDIPLYSLEGVKK